MDVLPYYSTQLGLVYNWWIWTGFGQDWGCLKSRNAVRLVVWAKMKLFPPEIQTAQNGRIGGFSNVQICQDILKIDLSPWKTRLFSSESHNLSKLGFTSFKLIK